MGGSSIVSGEVSRWYPLAAGGFPPLLNADYKLEANCKFCDLQALAVNNNAGRLLFEGLRKQTRYLWYAKIPYDFKLGPIRETNHPLILYICIVV